MTDLTTQQVATWVEKYLQAWRHTTAETVGAVFAEGAEFHERPYTTDSIGLDEILEMWLDRNSWEGTDVWTFEWQQVAVTGDTVALTGVGHYPALGDFMNLWIVTLNAQGKATMLHQWNNQI